MSDTLQPARQMDQVHPDADQLTAFAEHALPLHEREQTLAHLATCVACRQVVFLAQQAVDEDAVAVEPVRVRKPWFSGWNLVWTAALTVAGVAGISVYLRNFAKPVRTTDAVARVGIEPERVPVPSAPPLVEPVVPKPLLNPAAKRKAALAPAGVVGGVMTNAANGTLDGAMDQPPIELAKSKAAPATGQIHGVMAGSAAGVVSAPTPGITAGGPLAIRRSAVSGPAAQQIQQVPSQNLVQADQAAMAEQVPQRARVSGLAAAPRLAAAAPPPAPAPLPPAAAASASPTVAATNQTVTVEASPAVSLDAIATENAMISGRSIAAALLPSHLAASSSVAHGSLTLALDSAGSLFASKDQGRHWKKVKTQWDGHAAQLSVIQQSAYSSPRNQVFRLTTDTGAAWSSADGQHWTREVGGG